MQKETLVELVQLGVSTSEIAKRFSLGQTTIRYWLRKYGLKTNWGGYLKNRYKFSDDFLLSVWNTSDSVNDFLIKLGVGTSGGAWYHYRKRLRGLGIALDAIAGRVNGRKRGGERNAIKRNAIALQRKQRLKRHNLKKFMDLNRVEYKCAACSIDFWRGKPILLHIHHKDGDKTHNQIGNLEYLCPNCHSLEHYSED